MEQHLMTPVEDPDALPQPIGEYKPVDYWQAHINTLFYQLRGDQQRSLNSARAGEARGGAALRCWAPPFRPTPPSWCGRPAVLLGGWELRRVPTGVLAFHKLRRWEGRAEFEI